MLNCGCRIRGMGRSLTIRVEYMSTHQHVLRHAQSSRLASRHAASGRPTVELLESRALLSVPAFLTPISFTQSRSAALPRFADSAAIGDFNGDGRLDVITANHNVDGESMSFLLGKGDGTFQARRAISVGVWVDEIAVGDFNRDGKLDLATANPYAASVSILLGRGNGTFRPQLDYAVGDRSSGTLPTSIATGDFNGDRKLDLVTANEHNISVLLGDGTGAFTVKQDDDVIGDPVSVSVGDFNGDKKLDLLTRNVGHGRNHSVSLFLGKGDGGFRAPKQIITGSPLCGVVAGDFNGDRKLDVGTVNTDSNRVILLLGNGNGTFQPKRVFAAGAKPGSIATGDFNGDSNLDLAMGCGDNINILPGNGNGTFRPAQRLSQSATSAVLGTGDFNRDGKNDLLVLRVNRTMSSMGLSVLLNTTRAWNWQLY